MNNKLLLETYLLILKSTVEVYVHGTLESSNQDIREKMKEGLNQTIQNQSDTYDLMKQYGIYQVNNVDSNVINQTLSNIESKN